MCQHPVNVLPSNLDIAPKPYVFLFSGSSASFSGIHEVQEPSIQWEQHTTRGYYPDQARVFPKLVIQKAFLHEAKQKITHIHVYIEVYEGFLIVPVIQDYQEIAAPDYHATQKCNI